MWILTGVAVGIAQRIGLHHDGVSLRLPIFETKMRRSLWFQINALDGRAGELPGTGVSVMAQG